MAQTQHAGAKAATELLSTLVYELLDAHGDTAQLIGDTDSVPGWEVHLDYLRRLQRVGRETLAHCERLLDG